MADTLSMALADLLRKAEAEPDLDTLREGVRVLTQAIMEVEVAQHCHSTRPARDANRQISHADEIHKCPVVTSTSRGCLSHRRTLIPHSYEDRQQRTAGVHQHAADK